MGANHILGEVDVCNSCALISDGAGMSVGGSLQWGNSDYQSGNHYGAKQSYREALNILERCSRSACPNCLRAVRIAVDSL